MATAGSSIDEGAYRYWAFISYSHHDEGWARWLHSSLETYRIPPRLARRSSNNHRGLSQDRIYPVFRDRDELSGGFDLEERIKTALEQSRFLIVICSPHAAASRHVQQEIDTFESFGREHRVLCLIVDGEPGASARAASALDECLPGPVRTRKTGDGALVACEPIAADARKGKDGKANAKLKILAEMLEVPFDDLKQRDERRRVRRRLQAAGAAALVGTITTVGYLLALDAGLSAPGGTAARRLADRYRLSVMRPLQSEEIVHRQAATMRRVLAARLLAARRGEWFVSRFRPEDWRHNGIWVHSQTIFSLLNLPDGEAFDRAALASALELPFTSELKVERNGAGYGWLARPGESSPLAVPAQWTAMSLAMAVQKDAYASEPDRARALARLAYVDDSLAHYQPGGGAWNLFPNQQQSTQHNVYVATLALMILLEAKRAELPWQGSVEARDRLIRQTFDWLVGQFDPRAEPPGWKAGDDGVDVTLDGLSLQVFGRLLDARSEAGLAIPARILDAMRAHLAGIASRSLDFQPGSGEFYSTVLLDGREPFVARESIYFPWYAWAVDCAVRWLRSEYGRGAAVEDRVAVERTLHHLVVTLGEEAVTRATSGVTTFEAAEMLYGLSGVVPAE